MSRYISSPTAPPAKEKPDKQAEEKKAQERQAQEKKQLQEKKQAEEKQAEEAKRQRFVCSHATRQNVTISTGASGDFQAVIDQCDEWKLKEP